jgi:transposase
MPRQYSPELGQRAVRFLDTAMEASDISEFEAIRSTLANGPPTTSSEHAEFRRLKREVAELRRANEISESASAL